MQKAVGMFVKIVTETYLTKMNQYPPLIFRQDQAFSRLTKAMELNVWITDERLSSYPEITLDLWAQVKFEKFLNYKNYDSAHPFLKDVGVALEVKDIDSGAWENNKYSKYSYYNKNQEQNRQKHQLLLWYLNEDKVEENIKKYREQFQEGNVMFMRN